MCTDGSMLPVLRSAGRTTLTMSAKMSAAMDLGEREGRNCSAALNKTLHESPIGGTSITNPELDDDKYHFRISD